MFRGKQRLIFSLMVLIIALSGMMQSPASVFGDNSKTEDGSGKKVYVIPVEDEVERGLEAFLSRAVQEAEEADADRIIFEIDTPGGQVNAAGQIATLLQDIDIPTTSFVINQALSAGSYIALYTDDIYMTPQATMGASGIINQDGTAADEKAQSAWLAAMKGAAESSGKDPQYARAMADKSIDLPEYGAGKGKFLTLTPSSAVEVGYAKKVVKNRAALLNEMNLSNAEIHEVEQTVAEEFARFLTNPVVIPILLSVASLGLVVELYTPGFGLPGIMGLLSLVLFFYGHIIAGLAGMESVILLILGVVLIIAEFFVPGGIVGLIGVGAITGALLMAGYDLTYIAMSIGIAFIVTVVASVIMFKTMGLNRGVFKHIVHHDRETTEAGYVSSVNRLELIGMKGITYTPLRPSGTALFDDELLDVVSEGGFIEQNTQVKVIKTEGTRIVVRSID